METRSLKSGKIEIFSKGLVHRLVKYWPFFHVFVLGNMGQEHVFYDIL